MKPSPAHHGIALTAACSFAAALDLLAYQRETRPPGKVVASWPMWGGTPSRNLVNVTDRNAPADWDARPGKERNVKWSVTLGSKAAFWGPSVAGGKVFVGTNNQRPRDKEIVGDKGVLMCFRESDGSFLWQLVHDKLAAGRVNDWTEQGIASCPAVEGGRLWYVSNRCEVVCASVEGKVVWRLDMMKALGVFPHNLATCSPLVVGDALFVVTGNGVDEGHLNIPAPDAPSFLAIDKKTGKVLWASKLPGRNIMHGQWSNPAYAVANGTPQVLFPGGDGYVYSLNPKSGEMNWKFDCNPKGSVYRLGSGGTRCDFVATPVVWENKLYVAVGQDPEHKKGVGHLWCIDLTKTPKDKDKDVSPWSDPKREAPNAFDPKDPRNRGSALVWHYGGEGPSLDEGREYLFGRTLSTCAVHDGLCYAADFDGSLYCFDANTGKKLWEYELGGRDTWSSPYWVDGKVYIGNEAGEVHVFKHGRKAELVNKVQMKGKIRTTPVACNGVLYVVTENPCKLWAIKAR